MIIERIQSGSAASIDTSKAIYFKKGWKVGQKIIKNIDGLVIDPFARNCEWADITNDLNKNTNAQYHLDAKEFLEFILEKYGENSIKCLLFDPPFSNSQYKKYEKECENELTNIYAQPGKVPELFEIAQKLIKPGGIIIKLGYNSTRPIFDYQCKYLSITNFGGNRNDVILSIWINPNQTLF